MLIPRSDACAFFPSNFRRRCAVQPNRHQKPRAEKPGIFERALPLVALRYMGRAACHCRDGSTATTEERIYFGGALRGPPARFTAARKPRAAFPARRARETERDAKRRTVTPNARSLRMRPGHMEKRGAQRDTGGDRRRRTTKAQRTDINKLD
ncbi:hypothetical protein MRX96_046539 [Rhipicephalus microplus]